MAPRSSSRWSPRSGPPVSPVKAALTERLLASPLEALVAVELDRDLVTGLRQRFGGDRRFRLIEGDALEVPLRLADEEPPTKVVANIPYNITGPLLERLVREGKRKNCTTR